MRVRTIAAQTRAELLLTLRRGESGTLLYPTLQEKLIALNPGVVTRDSAAAVIDRIECPNGVRRSQAVSQHVGKPSSAAASALAAGRTAVHCGLGASADDSL